MPDEASSLLKIVSGGQTGVDRGGLKAAIDSNLPHGGWCPKGRRAEDGVIPAEFELRETKTDRYEERTELNVIDSDGTLLFYRDEIVGGTRLTQRMARRHRRPLLELNLSDPLDQKAVIDWLRREQINVLNIAGPRERNSPGATEQVRDFLASVFQLFLEAN